MADNEGRESSMQRQQQYAFPPSYAPDDEISLIDLWLVLVRRKWWVIGVAVAVTGLSLVYAAMQTDVYEYRQAVEIGSRIVDGENRLIEEPSSVAANLNEGVIPSATYDWISQNPKAQGVPSIEASAPQGARVVILKSEGAADRQEAIIELMENVSGRLVNDHRRVTETVSKEIAAELTPLENDIEGFKDERERLRSRIERLDERESLLEGEITDLQNLMTDTEVRQGQASESITGAAEAMTLLTLSSEARQTRQRIAELRKQLRVDLANTRDRLEGSIADQSRRLESARAEIGAKQSQLENLSKTQVVSPPRRSRDPVNSSTSLIVALGGVLGLMLGLFSALFAQFVSRAKEEASLRHDESASSTEAKR